MHSDRVVLITGAATGFGRQTGLLLARHGYRVFGTSRQSRSLPEYPMLTVDVAHDDSVRQGVQAVLDAAGRIDVLINNAGFVLAGLVEEIGIDQARALFEVNVLGCARMVNAVLPHFRKQRSGHIINISSLAGRVASPGHGYYSASKFALEGYTESLSHEVRPFNIHCTLIEPGFFRTDIDKNMVLAARTIGDYDAIRNPVTRVFEEGFRTGHDPADVARLIRKVIESKSPKLRYAIGPGAPWVLVAKALLPQKLFATGVRKYFHLT